MSKTECLFKKGDLIRFERQRITQYMEVDCCEGKTVRGFLCGSFSYVSVSCDKAVLVPPISVNPDRLRQFVRYEITARDFICEVFPTERLTAEVPYHMTPEDMLALVTRAETVGRNRFREEWLEIGHNLLFRLTDCYNDIGSSGTGGYRFLPDENAAVRDAYDELTEWAWGYDGDPRDTAESLREVMAMRDIPVPERAYSTEVKEQYIQAFDSDSALNAASDAELALFRQYADELSAAGNRIAMDVKAYACYGGNRAYPCDWVTSRDLLLRLAESGEKLAGYANTLGYIYYYGRCTDGVPEYDKAFRWFSIGAAGGFCESRYKQADMFMNGYGVPKCVDIAKEIIADLNIQNRKLFLSGHIGCKFADTALRVGRLALEDTTDSNRFDRAYFNLLEADYAIRMRMRAVDRYGDAKVAENIREALAEALPNISLVKPQYNLRSVNLSALLSRAVPENRLLEARFRLSANGGVRMRVRVKPLPDEKHPLKLFLTVMEAHFCGLVDSITLKCDSADAMLLNGKPLEDGAVVLFNSIEDNFLTISGMNQAYVPGDWSLTLKKPEKAAAYRMVSVCFGLSDKRYDYLLGDSLADTDLKPGDKVIVQTDRGEVEVTVQEVFTRTESEMAIPLSHYKTILRKA